jgi:nitrite reductase/ring-hydroxylating ferredoxin subunit
VSIVLSFVAVARLDQIPQDRGLRVVIDGIGIGLYRVGDAIHAMEDACPHAGYPLSEGELAGSVIACRAHGWPFDVRTGFDPDNADGFPVPCFAVEVEGNEVRIDLTDQINDPRRNRSLRQNRPRLGH